MSSHAAIRLKTAAAQQQHHQQQCCQHDVTFQLSANRDVATAQNSQQDQPAALVDQLQADRRLGVPQGMGNPLQNGIAALFPEADLGWLRWQRVLVIGCTIKAKATTCACGVRLTGDMLTEFHVPYWTTTSLHSIQIDDMDRMKAIRIPCPSRAECGKEDKSPRTLPYRTSPLDCLLNRLACA